MDTWQLMNGFNDSVMIGVQGGGGYMRGIGDTEGESDNKE